VSTAIKFLKAEKTGLQFILTEVQQCPIYHIGHQSWKLNGC
jgi:hypothetical protein